MAGRASHARRIGEWRRSMKQREPGLTGPGSRAFEKGLLASARHVEGQARPQHHARIVGFRFGIATDVLELRVGHVGDAITGSCSDGEAWTNRPLAHPHEMESNRGPTQITINWRTKPFDLATDRVITESGAEAILGHAVRREEVSRGRLE